MRNLWVFHFVADQIRMFVQRLNDYIYFKNKVILHSSRFETNVFSSCDLRTEKLNFTTYSL